MTRSKRNPTAKQRDKLAKNGIQILTLAMPSEEPAKEPKIPPPVQGPINNFYTDKIVSKDAMLAFIDQQFQCRRYHGMNPADYIPNLVSNGGYQLTPLGTCSAPDLKFIAAHSSFFERIANLRKRDDVYTELQTGKPVTDDNWMLYRDIMRIYSWEQMLTPEEKQRLARSATPLYIQTTGSQRGIVFRREPLKYRSKLLGPYKISFDPAHFVHLSNKDPAYIRFTPDEKSRERDLVVETTISKYLRKYHPSLTDEQLRDIANLHKFEYLEDGVLFFDDPKDIARVYMNGPDSCMSKQENVYKSPVHPAQMYGNSPGVKLAALPGAGEKFAGRCFVYDNPDNPADKRLIRVYGDSALHHKLEKKGYRLGNWENVKLRKIPFCDKNGKPLPATFVLAYIDDLVTGNGSDSSAQYVYTDDDKDYWIVVRRNQGNALSMTNKDKHPLLVAGTGTSGAIGQHLSYNAMRHNSYEFRFSPDGPRYREPSIVSVNEWNEFRCSACGGIFDLEYGTLWLKSTPTTEKWKAPSTRMCRVCKTQHAAGYHTLHKDDKEILIAMDNFIGLHKTKKIIVSMADVATKDRGNYDFLFPYQLIEHGYVRLHPFLYGRSEYEPKEKCTPLDGQWVRTADLIETVFGKPAIKGACYFLGQTTAGVLQYFPMDNSLIEKAFKEGRFVLVGDKIEYREDSRFSAMKRKKYFKVIGELEEEEDDAEATRFEQQFQTDTSVPIIELMNLIAGFHYAVQAMVNPGRMRVSLDDTIINTLRRMHPRVSMDILYMLVQTYTYAVKQDSFAGVESSLGIYTQLATVFAHGYLKDDDYEIDKETGEAILSKKAYERMLNNGYGQSYFEKGAAASFIRKESSKETLARNKGKKAVIRPRSQRVSNVEVAAFDIGAEQTHIRIRS
jgi:hypothetical protein